MTATDPSPETERSVIHPHELGMSVLICAPRSSFHRREGVIDEIAIYATSAHGIDFTGWDMLVAFHNGNSTAYSAFDFHEAEIIPPERARILDVVQHSVSPVVWFEILRGLKDAGLVEVDA